MAGKVLNVRDLGGIPVGDGRVTRSGVLVRGPQIASLSGKRAKVFAEEWGIGSIIDLRTPQEQKEKPDPKVPGTTYYSLPLFDEATSGISYEKSQRLKDKVKAIPDMPALYRSMVTEPDYVDNLRHIVHTVLEETKRLQHSDTPGAVYYHCTAGKDRTGIVTLLLLSLCHVPREAILQDYLRTNDVRVPRDELRIFAVSALLRDPEVTEGLRKVFRAEESYLNAAITAIGETWGSIDAFLEGPLQVTAAQREAFQKVFLEP
ncbi:MAG: tyrosine-protein phosphatase [Bacteroidales bacterium]|nr:tyrosine-protein phosphatase [Clostridia bacterium]MBQ8469886.1 tyrosine-protein phosphatase [Clostridia bacterium]MBR1699229.1 tyrosine-protein phosphatase [Bacteroidales bacterium]